MGQFANDTFTDGSGTLLQNHTPDDGGSWTEHPDSDASGDLEIQSNRLENRFTGTATSGVYHHSGNPSTAEYDIMADYIEPSVVGHSGVIGRMNTVAGLGGYYVRHFSNSDDDWDLFKVSGGSFTQLGSFNEPIINGETRSFKLEIRDSAKKLFVEGVERISSANNDITAPGKVGIRQDEGILDNFTADDAGGATSILGDVNAEAAQTSGAAGVTVSAIGDSAAEDATAAGLAGVTVAAAGGVASEQAQTAGAVSSSAQISGGVEAQPAQTSGAAGVTLTAAGDVGANDATADGDAGVTVIAAGGVTAAEASTSGDVSTTDATQISGGVNAEAAQTAGAVGVTVAATSDVGAEDAMAAGDAAVTVTITGAVVAVEATAAGSGSTSIVVAATEFPVLAGPDTRFVALAGADTRAEMIYG